MEHRDVELLRQHSAAWRLLTAKNAPLVISFLGGVFVDGNIREISAGALISRLDDALFELNRGDEPQYPRSPRAYLDDWADPAAGWLRKYYPSHSDEPHFDATPALEAAVAFVASLRSRDFVGTESRLATVFDLLRQIVTGTETDRERRLEDLLRERAVLDARIERVERGEFALLDETAQRDRFQQFVSLARALLSDFREVEANFRDLDRATREHIAQWSGGKGELLDEILASRGGIASSDQGKSFAAFYDFLLSSDRQQEFAELLDRVLALEAISGDPALRHIHHQWLDAGDRTQGTVRLLSEQLRRFLDDRVFLENRRVADLLRSIEARALELRDRPGSPPGMELDEPAPRLTLPMERRLYTARRRTQIESRSVGGGDEDFDSTVLYEQVHVDTAELAERVSSALAVRAQVGLRELIEASPLTRGLAELVAYLSLSGDAFTAVFDDAATEEVGWTDDLGTTRSARLPRVTFVRGRRDLAGADA